MHHLSIFKEIKILLQKDLQLELRKKQVLIGLLVYLLSTVFIIYTMEDSVDRQSWNTLFWMTMIFVVINTSAKAFLGESHYRQLFYFSRFSPYSIILSKQIYSLILAFIFASVCFILFQFFFPVVFYNQSLYFVVLVLGTSAISLCITFLSAISAQVQQGSAALTAIMGLPLLIPLFIIIKRVSTAALKPIVIEGMDQLMMILVGFDLIIVLLSVLLFPLVWTE